MGSNSSKINASGSVQTQKNDIDLDSNSDPRSPTPEIVRTPLQGKPGAKHNITKNVDLRKTFENTKGEEKLIHNNPILSAVIKNHLQSYDPRSPTQDFERTPIVISTKVDEITDERLPNETNFGSPSLRQDEDIDENGVEATKSPDLVVPKNLYDRFFDITLDDTFKETEEPLGSSTASNEALEVDISNGQSIIKELDGKPSKLLETNFDYVENEYENFEDSEENLASDNQDSKEDLKAIPLFKILNIDPRSPSVGIERTPIVVTKIKEEDTSAENVEEMSDDTLIKVLQNTNAELRQNGLKPQDRKSDGLLIYEDETTNINDTPKKSKSAISSGEVRTPLSCMKNKDSSHTRSKSVNTLYDPKTQTVVSTKMTTRVSHIPRLKSLSKQSKVTPSGSSISLKVNAKASALAGDCENTPPHSHRDRWDKDNSIVL